MPSGPGPRPVPPVPRVAIRHTSPWQPDRHIPAFLGPVVAGVRRRLAAAGGRGGESGRPPRSLQ